MAKLTLEGIGTVTVDDSFRSLSPEDQQRTVDEIAASMRTRTAAGVSSAAGASAAAGPNDAWPVRLAKDVYKGVVSGATLPGDVYAGRAQVPQSENMPGGESTENIGRTLDLAGLGLSANPAVASGDRAIAGVARNVARPPAPVTGAEGLKEASDAGYAAVRGLGVDLDPRIVPPFVQRAKMELDAAGLSARQAKKTHEVLDLLAKPPSEEGARTVFSLGNLDAARKELRQIGGNFRKPSDQTAALRAIDWLDDFATQLPPQAVLAGPAATAQKFLTGARGDWAAARRVNKLTGDLDNAVTGVVERGELAANAGRNAGTTIRQQLEALLKSKKDIAGFTPEEIKQIQRAAKVPISSKAGSFLGGSSPLGASLWTMAGGVGGTINPLAFAAAAAPIAGVGLKALSTRTTTKRANELAELLAKRSPTYEHRQAAMPLEPISPAHREALIRALLAGQEQQ